MRVKEPFCVWRAGEPMGARVIRGKLMLYWWTFKNQWIEGGRLMGCPVTDLTLATLSPMQIAQIWEELQAAHG
jgi:hypothetical protein